MIERLTIVRVANGWVARAGDIPVDEFMHVYTVPQGVLTDARLGEKRS